MTLGRPDGTLLNATSAQASAINGENSQQIAAETAVQLQERERFRLELEQQTKELELKKMLLVQQQMQQQQQEKLQRQLEQKLQQQRAAASSPLSVGRDRNRRDSQSPSTSGLAKTGSQSRGGVEIGRPRSPEDRQSKNRRVVEIGRPRSPEARQSKNRRGVEIGRPRSPEARQRSPTSPGGPPNDVVKHTPTPQQRSSRRRDSSSPSAEAGRQAIMAELNALKRELMLKHSERTKSAAGSVETATLASPATPVAKSEREKSASGSVETPATASSPTPVAKSSHSAAHENLPQSPSSGGILQVPPGEDRDRILGMFLQMAPGMKMFRGVDIRLVHRLFSHVQVIKAGDDIRLVEAGSEGHSMYFLLHGQCNVYVTGKKVSEMKAPCTFGEIALLLSERRSADVCTCGPCILCELTQVMLHGYANGN